MSERVAQITTVHRAEDVRIHGRIAATLAEAGFDSVVVAPGETWSADGVSVIGLGEAQSRIGRLRLIWRAFWIIHRESFDIVQLHDPELLILAPLLKLQRRVRVIYDVHDDLSETLRERRWLPRLVRRPLATCAGLLERVLARTVDCVTAATPRIARRFEGAVVVQNFPDVATHVPRHPTPDVAEPLRLIYVGEMNPRRGARELAAAVSLASANQPVQLDVFGDVKPGALRRELRAVAGDTLRFHGWIAPSKVAWHMRQADVGLVTFHPGPNHDHSQPRKLFEYMANGLAVVASDLPRWREIVDGAECGLLVDPLSPTSIAEALLELAEDRDRLRRLGERGHDAALTQYSWATQRPILLSVYANLLDPRSRRD